MDSTNTLKISRSVAIYLKKLKDDNENESYELLMLMLLNNELRNFLIEQTESSINTIEMKEGNFTFRVPLESPEYEVLIKNITESLYFKKNFNKEVISRKIHLMRQILTELSLVSVIPIILKGDVSVDFEGKRHPSITHKTEEINNIKTYTLSFTDVASLDEITDYLKKVINLKNTPKKKKLSLGKAYRLLMIKNEITSDKKYLTRSHTYKEQLVANEFERIYGNKIDWETVKKNIQRIEKISKEINTK